jgi:hypothetical protein
MSDLNKAAEAAKNLTRTIEAFATVGKALEGIASLEAAAAFAASEAERRQTELLALSAKVGKAQEDLYAAQAETEKAKAETEAAVNAAREEVNAAKAEAKALKAEYQKVADGIVETAKASAAKIVADANDEAVAVETVRILAQAEVDRLNGIIAEARAKLGV